MSVSGMTVGRSYSIGLYDANTRQVIDLGQVQNFRATAQKHNILSRPYNAPPIFGYIPDGYSGRFGMIRTGPAVENFFLSLNTLFNQGGDLLAGYINETITETGGAVSRYQYRAAVFFLTEIADVSREKTVPQTIEWMASDKGQVA